MVHRRQPLSTLLLVGICLLALLLLSACGDDDGGGGGGEDADATSASGSTTSPAAASTPAGAGTGDGGTPAMTGDATASMPADAGTGTGTSTGTGAGGGEGEEAIDPRLITVEEANERLPFTLLVPEPLPEGITLNGVLLGESNDQAIISLHAEDWTLADGHILLSQQQSPFGPPTSPDHQEHELQIGDTTVTRVTMAEQQCLLMRTYEWNAGDQHVQLLAGLLPETDQEVLQPLLASLLQVSTDDITAVVAEADANPTPVGRPTQDNQFCNLQPEEAEELVGFTIAMPEDVPDALWLRDIYVEGPLFGSGDPANEDAMAVVQRFSSTRQRGHTLELRQSQSEQAAMMTPPRNSGQENSGQAEPTILTIADTDVTFIGSDDRGAGTPPTGTATGDGSGSDGTSARRTLPDTFGMYHWQVGDTLFALNTRFLMQGSELSAEEVEAFIASVIAAAE